MSFDFGRLPRTVVVAVVLLALVAAGTWAALVFGPWRAGPSPTPSPLERQPSDGVEPIQAAEPRTGAATTLVFDTAGLCRRVEDWTEAAGTARAGLDPAGLEAVLPGWRVASFSADRVHLLPVDGTRDCPDRRPFTLVVRDGQVVILAGSGRDGPVHESSGIPASRLASGDLAVLANGHTVEGLDRAWEYLEGIAEHQMP